MQQVLARLQQLQGHIVSFAKQPLAIGEVVNAGKLKVVGKATEDEYEQQRSLLPDDDPQDGMIAPGVEFYRVQLV